MYYGFQYQLKPIKQLQTYISILSLISVKCAPSDLLHYLLKLLADHKMLSHISTQYSLDSSLAESRQLLRCQAREDIILRLRKEPLEYIAVIVLKDTLVVAGLGPWMLHFLVIHIVEARMSSVVAEGPDHG